MKTYEFAQQYYKRLAEGETLIDVHSDVLVAGEALRHLDIGCLPFSDIEDGRLTWKPKAITVTYPAPMTEIPIWWELSDAEDAVKILFGANNES